MIPHTVPVNIQNRNETTITTFPPTERFPTNMSHINNEGRRRSTRHSPFPSVDSIEHEIESMLTPVASAQIPQPQNTQPSMDMSPSTSNDLLSYDKSSATPTVANDTNPASPPKPQTSIQSDHYAIHAIPTTVSTDIPPTDPTILQLQASIRAIARRITTIQEVTESRFETIHSDFRQTQTELTNILKEGLTDMSKQRMDDMQFLRNQAIAHTRPASPPPPVSFLGSPDVRSTTSSLGDPPASCETITSNNTASTTKSKPDPPEIITPTTQYKQKPIKTPEQLPHPLPVTTPPISPPQLISHQPTIIVKTVKDPSPLTFKSFKKDHSYSDFKTACLIRANTDTYYSNLVSKDDAGRLIWHANATEKESQILHLATTTAMGVSATNLIDRSDHSPCGITLWTTLDKHYLKSYKSLVLRDKLKKEYETLKKDRNESYTKYVSRVESKIEQLEFNEIKAGPMAERAYRLIDGLNMPQVFGDILMKIENDESWHKNMTLRDVMQKAEDHHDLYVAIHGEVTQARTPQVPRPPAPSPRSPIPRPRTPIPPSPRTPAPTPRQPHGGNPSPPQEEQVRNPYNSGPNTDEKHRIKSHLAQQSNKLCAIFGLAREHQLQCPLHYDAQHSLIDCWLFENLCQDVGAATEFKSVRSDLGLGPMRERPDYRNNRSGTPNAYPPRTQPVARRVTQSENRYAALDGRYETDETPATIDEAPSNPDTQDNISNNEINVYTDCLPPFPPSCNNPLVTPPSQPQSPSCPLHPATFYCRHTSSINLPTDQPTLPSSTINAVIDSGASHTMTNNLALFDTITYFDDNTSRPTAIMGDDKTSLPIFGYGMISYLVDGYKLRTKCYYVPQLGVTLISVKQHIRYQGCCFHAEDNQAILAYPTFMIHPSVRNEIEIHITPLDPNTHHTFDFDELHSQETPPPSHKLRSIMKHNLKHTLDLYPTTIKPFVRPTKSVHFTETVEFQRFTHLAKLPSQSTPASTGFDIHSVGSFSLQPGISKSIPTGLAASLPPSMSLRLVPHSCLSSEHISIKGGVVHHDRTDEIKITITNTSPTTLHIDPSQPFALAIFEKATIPYLQVVPFLSKTSSKGGCDAINIKKPATKRLTSHLQANDDVILIDRSKHCQSNRRIQRRDDLPTVQNKPQEDVIDPNPATFSSTTLSLNMANPKLLESSDKTLTSPTNVIPSSSSSVSAALPKAISMTRESLLQSIGYLKPDTLLKNLNTLTNMRLHVESDTNPKLDPGSTASMRSSKKNKVPNPLPTKVGDVWHMDIGFGPCTSIGGIKYTLLLVDKRSRYKLVYGLKNLKSSLLQAMKKFLTDCGTIPSILRTDFDSKLMGGKVGELLESHRIKVQSSPPYRQHQNGLVERHWQTVVNMARNWLTSSLLPSRFWFHAIKRACEVCNILPTTHMPDISTPHSIQFGEKVDLRQLFPMFSVAYIKYPRGDGKVKTKWMPKSLKCIVIGKCSISDGLIFYHPPSKQTITCGDGYKFDTFSPAGPQFDQKFDGNFVFCTKGAEAALHRPPTHEQGTSAYVTQDNGTTYLPITILSVPVNDDDDPYTVQEQISGDILEVLADEISPHNPHAPLAPPTITNPFPHLPWIQHGAKVTLFLSDRMPHPKQGVLQQGQNKWTFLPGRKQTNTPMDLPNFDETGESLVHNRKLFSGWKSRTFVLTARQVRATSNVIASTIYSRKVSAAGLNLMQAPTLLKHHKLHPDDKSIWDAAYKSEYDGLQDIDTWELITEDEYQNMRHLYKGVMPTMAIATIKYDGQGNPIRAKYRIVALGNLDHNMWTKSECFAPVLSQLELRFLTALAARKRCIPKTGDVNQAFCQSFLPQDEHYICRPPAGCPFTPPDSYLKLKKTLYGLKRSPRHFYKLARKILLSIGLKQHPTSPCIFYGSLIKGEPPLFLGLYVDDFLYFSESEKVEQVFQERFGAEIDTDFNGKIGYFLGINFDCTRHDDDNVTIHLSQEAFIDNLCELAGLSSAAVNTVKTPYKSGYPVDTIPFNKLPQKEQGEMIHTMQVYIGCLTWLSISTRPDIATITNILAKYTTKCNSGHIDQVKRTIRYLKGTKTLGISFSSKNQDKLESHIKFPVDDPIMGLCDANWGPQDQSKPRPNESRTTPLFTNRSLSGFLIYFSGPLHWVSKRQTVTARSSAESEIYATDECTKCLLQLHHIVEGLGLTDELMKPPTIIYNDNAACVAWSRNSTTKGLRHIQIRENAVCESVQNNFIRVEHIAGKLNLSDMFTKEDKDTLHFLTIRDVVLTDRQNARLGIIT